MVEAEMYDTDNNRSLDEWIQERKLFELLKIRLFRFKIYIKRTKYLIELTDPKVSVQNFKMLMRWNKTLIQYFP